MKHRSAAAVVAALSLGVSLLVSQDHTATAATWGSVLTPNDFNEDYRTDLALFRPSNGTWYLGGGQSAIQYGQSGDIPATRDNGGARATVSLFRPSTGTWYQRGSASRRWGHTGDIPVQAHYNGLDLPTVIAVWRPATAQWLFDDADWGAEGPWQYGAPGDIPVPARYHGSPNNRFADEMAVWRPSTGQWWVQGYSPIRYGVSGDVPVPGDYDYNGTSDIAVWRPSTGDWWVRGRSPVRWGQAGDVPVTGDFNGDGRFDFAVWRPSTGTWWVRGMSPVHYGVSGDIPVPSARRRG